jgi:hypothetical protein
MKRKLYTANQRKTESLPRLMGKSRMSDFEERKNEENYVPRFGNSMNSSGLSEPTPGSRGGSLIVN